MGSGAAGGDHRGRGPRPQIRTLSAVVDHVDFTVGLGEIFGLLGPQRRRQVHHLQDAGRFGWRPTDGEALVLRIDLRRAAAVARGRIGYMAQKFSLYGNLSAPQNLPVLCQRLWPGGGGGTGTQSIEAAFGDFGLDPYREAISYVWPPVTSSGSPWPARSCTSPASCSWTNRPRASTRWCGREFWGRINAMAAAGVTVMVTTHFMEEAEYCDRVGIIYRGRLVALGTPERPEGGSIAAARCPDPTLEDAFVDLIERYDSEHAP